MYTSLASTLFYFRGGPSSFVLQLMEGRNIVIMPGTGVEAHITLMLFRRCFLRHASCFLASHGVLMDDVLFHYYYGQRLYRRRIFNPCMNKSGREYFPTVKPSFQVSIAIVCKDNPCSKILVAICSVCWSISSVHYWFKLSIA